MALRLTLRQLEYLVAVGEAGSVAGAAARVNVSAPSVSTAIAQLEEELGLPLFVRRHAQGLTPTQGGRKIMEEARAVLSRAARLHELAAEITGTVRGPFAVGCLVTFAQMVLPTLRRGFVGRYPAIEFHQTELDQAGLFDALRSARLDLALTYDLAVPADLEFVELARLPPYAVLPDAHPLADRKSVSVRELADHPMVLLDLPMSADYFLSFFAEAGVAPLIAERTRDMGVMRGLVASGFGYSIANIRPLSDRAPDGRRLRFVPLSGPLRPMRMGLLLSEGARSLMSVRAFIDHCRHAVAEGRVPGLAAAA